MDTDSYRRRETGLIYDDACGVWTEEDQIAASDKVFKLFDKEEQKIKRAGRRNRR